MSDGRCPCCGAAEWCPAENAKADARERDPHPECTLERVRELERQLAHACIHVLNLRGAIHEALRLYAGGREHGDILRAALKASPAPTSPPAAEPVTEQERAVLRAMRGAGEEDVQGLEPYLPDDLVEAWLAWIDARAAAREGNDG